MSDRAADAALSAASRFALPGPAAAVEPFGAGRINGTWRVTAGGQRFVLQRLNPEVFPDPKAVVENTRRVTEHLQARLRAEGATDPERRSLTLVPAVGGDWSWTDGNGAAWRCTRFLEGTRSLGTAEGPAQAYAAARAFGVFLRLLEDMPEPPLRETIPHFHDGRRRYLRFEEAVARDAAGRAREAREEIAFGRRHEALAGMLQGLRERGELPLRPTHQDTKLDNLLVDAETNEPLCVVDLDTTMPGLALGDFGDLARSACCRVAEDGADLDRLLREPTFFGALAAGFQAGLGPGFTELERSLLLDAAMAFALVLGLRFLTDHLEGDRYFRTERPGQNLERARLQFALLRAFQAQEGALRKATARPEA